MAAGPPTAVLGAPRARYGARVARRDEGLAKALAEVAPNVSWEEGPGGPVVTFGEPEDARALARAFDVLAAAGASPASRAADAGEDAYLQLLAGASDA